MHLLRKSTLQKENVYENRWDFVSIPFKCHTSWARQFNGTYIYLIWFFVLCTTWYNIILIKNGTTTITTTKLNVWVCAFLRRFLLLLDSICNMIVVFPIRFHSFTPNMWTRLERTVCNVQIVKHTTFNVF